MTWEQVLKVRIAALELAHKNGGTLEEILAAANAYLEFLLRQ